MKRDRAIRIIRRIVETLEAGGTPATVRELYVFGSFARGAVEPNDLDLIVVHDPTPVELIEQFKQRASELRLDFGRSLHYPAQRFRGAMGKALRKPGEAIDLLLGTSFQEVAQTYTVLRNDTVMLLWSQTDRGVESKLAGIAVDPDAGRAERPGFMTSKEAGCTAQEMRHVATMLDRNMLLLNRWTLTDEPPELHGELRRCCEWWVKIGTMGKKSLQSLPYAFHWLQEHGATDVYQDVTEVYDREGSYFARVGPMGLDRMLWRLQQDRAQAVCLIPHFKRGQSREAFEFRRSSDWVDDWQNVLEAC